MGTLYVDTGGNALNSGSSNNASPDLSGTGATFISGTTVQLDSGTVLTGINTSGVNQSAINIAGATNAGRTVFWITGTSGSGTSTPQITLDVAPTGMTTNSWRIGGQYLFPTSAGAAFNNSLRGGDVLQFNNQPAARSNTFITFVNSGDTANGYVYVMGKPGGSRVVLDVGTYSGPVFSGTSTPGNIYFQNLELRQSGTSGNILGGLGV